MTAIADAMERAQNAEAGQDVTYGKNAGGTSGQEVVDQLSQPQTIMQRTDEEVPEPKVDDSQMLGQLTAKTPWWITDYHHWRVSKNGTFYLAPNEDTLNLLLQLVPDVLAGAYKKVYPESGETDEAESVATRVKNITEMDQEDARFGWTNMIVKRRKDLVQTCISRALYAARTQFELNSWATRLARQNKPQPDTFDEKKNRCLEQGLQAAVAYAILQQLDPVDGEKTPAVDDASINRIVKQLMWDDARYRGNEILNPMQQQKDEEATKDAEQIHVQVF